MVVPVILICICMYLMLDVVLFNTAMENRRESVRQISHNISILLDYNYRMLNKVALDSHLPGYLDPGRVYTPQASIDAYQEYLNIIAQYGKDAEGQDSQLNVYFVNESLLPDYTTFLRPDETVRESEVFQRTVAAGGLPVWSTDESGVVVSRAIFDRMNGQFVGAVYVRIPEATFFNQISEFGTTQTIVAVLDESGYVVSSTDEEYNHRGLGQEIYYSAVLQSDRFFIESVEYQSVIAPLFVDRLSLDWNIAMLVPLHDLQSLRWTVIQSIIIIMLIWLPISMVFFFVPVYRITKRVKLLASHMTSSGELMPVADTGPPDEIRAMMRSYNDMVHNIKDLIYSNYEAQLKIKDNTIRRREVELSALESRMNPHFLFNTLESIRMDIVKTGNTELSDIIARFAKIMRRSLKSSIDLIPLSEEAVFTSDFLEIHCYRFKRRITYLIDIDERSRSALIPKLTLEAIAENSIKHGLDSKQEAGSILIHSYMTEDNLVYINVEDDGVGISEQKLSEIREKLRNDSPDDGARGIGLPLIKERLRQYFGETADLDIFSNPGSGTKVTLIIPAVFQD